jgi:lyso-ornithine lipid O-acyltransferase
MALFKESQYLGRRERPGSGKIREPLIRPFFAFFVAVTLVSLTLPIQYLLISFKSKHWWITPSLWHRLIARLVNINITIKGDMVTDKPVLFVANHLSWADIFVLGAKCKNSGFVAKAEIESWGLIGWLAKMQYTQYVNRNMRSDSKRQRDRLIEQVHEGRNLILFPEGTTTDGNKVIAFKSALFSVAEELSAIEHDLVIQPVTLSYVEIHGMPVVRARRPHVTWMGEVGILHHFRQHFKHGPIDAMIEFHAPIHYRDFSSRKAVANYCRDQVQHGLERANKGHLRGTFD